jgi:hypothetical protein
MPALCCVRARGAVIGVAGPSNGRSFTQRGCCRGCSPPSALRPAPSRWEARLLQRSCNTHAGCCGGVCGGHSAGASLLAVGQWGRAAAACHPLPTHGCCTTTCPRRVRGRVARWSRVPLPPSLQPLGTCTPSPSSSMSSSTTTPRFASTLCGVWTPSVCAGCAEGGCVLLTRARARARAPASRATACHRQLHTLLATPRSIAYRWRRTPSCCTACGVVPRS